MPQRGFSLGLHNLRKKLIFNKNCKFNLKIVFIFYFLRARLHDLGKKKILIAIFFS